MFSGGFFLLKEILNPKIKKKKQDSRAGQMLISPIHSDDFACIPIFVEFRAVTGNPPTQSHKSVMNQGHIQGKREENRSSKKRRGTGEKKIKKTNKETDSVRRNSVWRSLPRQPQPSFVVHLLFGWSSLTESLEQATDMFQFISARSLNYLYHSFSSVPLSRPRRVHR